MSSSQPAAGGPVPAAIPFNEARRLDALNGYGVLDTPAEQAYDDLAALAGAVCRTPIALITLVDKDRQWFKSRIGLDLAETARELSFSAHAILEPDQLLEVGDASLDPRFATNPLVTGDPRIRFYAGAPLVTPEGLAIGTVCVIDREPRRLLDTERAALQALARQVVALLALRQASAERQVENMMDALTGLWNRSAFDRRLSEEWNRRAHNHGHVSLLMVDLDRLGRINDEFGQPAGDQALIQAGQVMRRTVRISDVVARIRDDEFAVILPDTDLLAAIGVAEKVRAALQLARWPHRAITASIGVAAIEPTTEASAHGLIARADRALYAAKSAGRNQVHAFTGWV